MNVHQTEFQLRSFLLPILVPTVVTIILFIFAFFFFIIPSIMDNSMERKKEMIKELTTSAWNILAKHHDDEKKGILTREEAQRQVVEQIQNLHYGQRMKDYFWINDMTPRMIIHPYRTDLNGKNLADYSDPDGKKVFMEMVSVVADKGSGYIHYKWQEKDSSSVVIPKISYVMGFEPWGWILGTGINIEDVNVEIDQLVRRIMGVSIIICTFNALLFLHITNVSYQAYKKKQEAERELKKTKSSLVLSEKMASLGTLSAMVAHEINNPLSGILSYAKLSMRMLEKPDADKSAINAVADNLAVIASEAKRCGGIVKNLLLFAKQSLGNVRDVRLNDIVTLSAKVIDHSAKMKDIELKTELGAGDDTIQCDPGAVQQILVSLIVNSLESSQPGKEVIVRTDYSDVDTVRISVMDFGYGIEEKDLPFIFDPFFSTKESNSSLGLGLSAVYGIVQRHEGTIHVESAPGSGTEFTIMLPRRCREQKEN